MTSRERALKALERTTSWLQKNGHLLPPTARQQISDDCDHLRKFLELLGSEQPGPQLAAVVAEAGALLWNAVATLEGRLTEVEGQLTEVKGQLTEVEAQLEKLQPDHGKLLLRQMGSQVENKLARLAKPGLAPKSAVHMTFKRLSKGNDKGIDKQAFQQVVSRYPKLQDGLESLKNLGTPIAHPEKACMKDGSEQTVTITLLQDLIDKEYSDDDPVKPDVEEVLCCLDYLAQTLNENLFVSTM